MSKEFKFNQHSVCINPDLALEIKEKEDYDSYIITLCEFEGKWDYGYRVCGGYSMGSSAPSTKNGKFHSRQAAFMDAVEYLRRNANYSLKQRTDINNSEHHKKIAKKFLEWYNSNVLQPTLF